VSNRQNAASGGYDEAPPAAAPAPAPAEAVDLSAEIQKLADLHGQGILTDEEFAAAKAKLIG